MAWRMFGSTKRPMETTHTAPYGLWDGGSFTCAGTMLTKQQISQHTMTTDHHSKSQQNMSQNLSNTLLQHYNIQLKKHTHCACWHALPAMQWIECHHPLHTLTRRSRKWVAGEGPHSKNMSRKTKVSFLGNVSRHEINLLICQHSWECLFWYNKGNHSAQRLTSLPHTPACCQQNNFTGTLPLQLRYKTTNTKDHGHSPKRSLKHKHHLSEQACEGMLCHLHDTCIQHITPLWWVPCQTPQPYDLTSLWWLSFLGSLDQPFMS